MKIHKITPSRLRLVVETFEQLNETTNQLTEVLKVVKLTNKKTLFIKLWGLV